MEQKSNDSISGTLIDRTWFLGKISKLYDIDTNKKQIPGHKDSQFGRWSIPEPFIKNDSKNQEYEEESHPFYFTLTLIWDLSILEGMAKFMLDMNIHKLFFDIQDVTDVERIKEICIGIIANMACQGDIARHLAKDVVINMTIPQLYIDSYDAGVMNECLRYINNVLIIGRETDGENALKSQIKKNCQFLNKIIFTLTYSANEPLLLIVIESLCSLLEMETVNFESTTAVDCLMAIIEAFKQIMSLDVQSSKCRNFVHAYQMIVSQELQTEASNEIRLPPNVIIDQMETFVKYLRQTCPSGKRLEKLSLPFESTEAQCDFLDSSRGKLELRSPQDNAILACLRNIQFLIQLLLVNSNGLPSSLGVLNDVKSLMESMHDNYESSSTALSENVEENGAEVGLNIKNDILEEINTILASINNI